MKHARTVLRAAALVSSFGLIGGYVACQQNGGRLPLVGDGGADQATPAATPAAGPGSPATAPAFTPANFSTKSDIVFKPDAQQGTGTLLPGSKSSGVGQPMVLSGSKSLVLTPTTSSPPLFVGSKSGAVFFPLMGQQQPPLPPKVEPAGEPAVQVGPAPATRPATAPATRPEQQSGVGHMGEGQDVVYVDGPIDWHAASPFVSGQTRPATRPTSRPAAAVPTPPAVAVAFCDGHLVDFQGPRPTDPSFDPRMRGWSGDLDSRLGSTQPVPGRRVVRHEGARFNDVIAADSLPEGSDGVLLPADE